MTSRSRGQTSWLLGLIAGVLVGAVLWFGLTQMPFSPFADSTSNATASPTTAVALSQSDCIRAALASDACLANGTIKRSATFTHADRTYPCHCNTPESDGSENRTEVTPWPDENGPQPTLEPWPDADQINTTVVAGPTPIAKPAGFKNRSDGAIRLTRGDGSEQNPAFLDENTLAFTRFSQGYNEGPAALMGMYLDNLTEFVIWQDEAQNVNTNGNPFTPDKKRICYSSDVEDTDEIGCLDLATKNRTRITRHDDASQYFEPSVSFDGTRIAFERRVAAQPEGPGQIWTTDFSGSARSLISDGSDNRLPQFNPADGRLLFQRRTGSPEENTFQLVIRHPNGTLETLALPTAGGTDASWAGTDEVVYSSEDERFEHARIFSYNVATKTGRQETFDSVVEDGAPAVSPDGDWLAFESHETADENSPTRIWIIRRP